MLAAMSFDFDRIIDRRGTDSAKWAAAAREDLIPMPVADMDFAPPPAVIGALQRRLDHAVYGYAHSPSETLDAVVFALERDYGWRVDPSWIFFMPGVVPGLQLGCRMMPSDARIITFVPVYPPFLSPSVLSGRAQVRVPLAETADRFEIDYDRLEHEVPSGPGLLLWCHPQNPTGRVFPRRELERVAEFCLRRDLLLLSDEIHCDLILHSKERHTPTASLSSDVAARTVTLMAPSKTYNIPGLCAAFAVIPDAGLRRRFVAEAASPDPPVNVFGYRACAAAYRDGAEWRAALLDYLRANERVVREEIEATRGLRMHPVEATYLAWVDARGLDVEDPASHFRRYGVELSDGRAFGAPGWVRLNFGCPRSTLCEGLRRVRAAAAAALAG